MQKSFIMLENSIDVHFQGIYITIWLLKEHDIKGCVTTFVSFARDVSEHQSSIKSLRISEKKCIMLLMTYIFANKVLVYVDILRFGIGNREVDKDRV